MINRIVRFSITHRIAVLFCAGFLAAYGVWAMRHLNTDALPDLSDTQVIIYSKWNNRSPSDVEAQVTYPITSALLGAAKVKTVRGVSDFGVSYIYVLFEDGTDPSWARARIVDLLSRVQPLLPPDAKTQAGPDATSVGWVYQYALIDTSGTHPISELRSLQDWQLRYALQSVPGVAEVASIGGFEKQIQVAVDPIRLRQHGVSLMSVVEAVRRSNSDAGGGVIEFSGAEYMVRSLGSLQSVEDLERAVVSTAKSDPMDLNARTSVLLRDVARIEISPRARRGVSDLEGRGDAVGGIVVMQQGENAESVVRRVKARLNELHQSLPDGVKVVTTYDRSEFIERVIANFRGEILACIIVVSLVILLFLFHIPSAVVPIVSIPVTVLLTFLAMRWIGVDANVVSLAGIALSLGVLVDGAIVQVENVYRRVAHWKNNRLGGDFHAIRLQAILEVSPSVFFSLLLIAASFLPIFALAGQEGRLFQPLAFSKTLVMLVAALLVITVSPALLACFSREQPFVFRAKPLTWLINKVTVGEYKTEEKQFLCRLLIRLYEPVADWVLRRPKLTITLALLLISSTVPVYFHLGSEFMPPLDEGSVLYMPVTLPGISAGQVAELLQRQDQVLMSFPEVEHVFGKAGHADTATDPAPLSMIETTIVLKPRIQWRARQRWYSNWSPEWLKGLIFRKIADDHISYEQLIQEMDDAVRWPGVTNSWTMPIKGRTDMLATGIRTPVAVKVLGPDAKTVQEIGIKLEDLIKGTAGTNSVFAERVSDGYFLDFRLNRERLADYGLTVADAQEVIATAIGGEDAATLTSGRERYQVNVRYPRAFRESIEELKNVTIVTQDGTQVPLSVIAEIEQVSGPGMLRSENGMLAGYVFIQPSTEDLARYVETTKALVQAKIVLPAGYSLLWSGQYESIVRVRQRLKAIIPATIALILLLLFFNTRSMARACLVLLAVPFSLVGAIWFLYALGYKLSIATWVGMVALMGLDAETGVFMLLYLDLAYSSAVTRGLMNSRAALREAIMEGAVRRIRPKMMTVVAAFMGLLPIMWSNAAGSDLAKRIVAPIVGGLATSFVLELLVYPAIYFLCQGRSK